MGPESIVSMDRRSDERSPWGKEYYVVPHVIQHILDCVRQYPKNQVDEDVKFAAQIGCAVLVAARTLRA